MRRPVRASSRRHAVAPGDRRHGLAWVETLLDDPQLCFRRPMPTPGDACDHLNALILLGHRPILKPVLEPFCLCRVAGRNGGQFTDPPNRLYGAPTPTKSSPLA